MPKEGNFEGKIKSHLPYPREDFLCSPQLPSLSLSSSFFSGNQITYAYFSSFFSPREIKWQRDIITEQYTKRKIMKMVRILRGSKISLKWADRFEFTWWSFMIWRDFTTNLSISLFYNHHLKVAYHPLALLILCCSFFFWGIFIFPATFITVFKTRNFESAWFRLGE